MRATITPADLATLAAARKLQIERYRTEYFRENRGQLPPESDPQTCPEWLPVEIGGELACVRVSLLAKWGGTFAAGTPLVFDYSKAGEALTVSHGTSSLRTFTLTAERIRGETVYGEGLYGRGQIVALPEPPVPLTVEGGALKITLPNVAGVTADLATLRAEITANRKAIAREKAIAKARKAERFAVKTLEDWTKRAGIEQANFDAFTPAQAVEFARRCLHARRVFRRSLASLDTLPDWLPLTFSREVFDCETQAGKVETVDTRAEWGERIAAVNTAKAASEAYKPRADWPSWIKYTSEKKRGGLSIEAYKRKHPEHARKVYGPAFGKLKKTERQAVDSLYRFLAERYREHLAAHGLPEALATTYGGLYECSKYSRARLLLREWPALREDLESKVREAKEARERAEA